jgi:hypothetical protein
MTDTFRALCARMADELDHYRQLLVDDRRATHALAAEARAALAQPEPQGFTPDHVNLMCFAFEREPWATWLRRGGCLESAHCELSDLMLAVLARWGRPAIEPVPVSERLPGPEDCDAVGRCWCFNPVTSAGGIFWWSFEPLDYAEDATHWLPHWVLPVPGVEGADD